MINSNDEKKKKKDLTLKASPSGNDDGEINDEEMVFFTRNIISKGEKVWWEILKTTNLMKCYKYRKQVLMANMPSSEEQNGYI